MQRARSEEAKEQRRADILDAALDEFYEKGFSSARLDDIAARAGVSKGALYLYFSSKEDLFRDLIDYHTQPTIERLDQAVSVAPSLEQVFQNVANLAPHIIDQGKMPALMKVMIGESQVFPEIVKRHREKIVDRSNALFAKALCDARDRGEITVENPELTARLIFAPVVYCAIWKSVFEPTAYDPLDHHSLIQTHMNLLLNGLKSTLNEKSAA